jgi:hypothetical protein
MYFKQFILLLGCIGLGLRSLTEKIDKDADLEGYIKQYGGRASRTQKTDIPYKEYSMSKTAKSVLNPNPVFGVDLALLMERDREEVPVILRKCAEAVETYGKTIRILFGLVLHVTLISDYLT